MIVEYRWINPVATFNTDASDYLGRHPIGDIVVAATHAKLVDGAFQPRTLMEGFVRADFPADRPGDAVAWLADHGAEPEREARMVSSAVAIGMRKFAGAGR